MRSRKRGLKDRKNFFRGNKLVLDSFSSKIAFVFIVFLFGVVFAFAGMDVLDVEKGSEGEVGMSLNGKDKSVFFSPSTLEGTSEVIHYDYFDQGRSENFYYLRISDGTRYKLNFVQGSEPNIISGKNIKVTGTLSNVASGENEINVDNLEVLEDVTAEAEPNPNLGEQRTAVILVNFQDYITQSRDSKEIIHKVFFSPVTHLYKNSVNSYFMENSYNKTWLNGSIYGYYNLSITQQDLWDLLKTHRDLEFLNSVIEVSDTEINFLDYDRLVIYSLINESNNFPIQGWAYLDKIGIDTSEGYLEKYVSFLTLGRYLDPYVAKHEITHTFGVGHSNFYDCGNETIDLPQNCESVEGGDFFSGLGNRHLNAVMKERIGWFEPKNVILATEGIYKIYPIELKTDEIQVLKIPLNESLCPFCENSKYYYIEYKRAVGLDEGNITIKPVGEPNYRVYKFADMFNGTIFHIPMYSRSLLLDTSPHVSFDGWSRIEDDYIYVVLKKWEKFHDSISNVTITTLDVNDNYLEVYVGDSKCGNSLLETGETCDDSNTINGDGCSSACKTEPYYKVFITSQSYTGNIGGVYISGVYGGMYVGDSICTTTARNSGQPSASKWVAWLSDNNHNIGERMYQGGGYRTLNGKVVAKNWFDLIDGKLDNPIKVNEFNQIISGAVWTGTLNNSKSALGNANCNYWYSNSTAYSGYSGNSSAINGAWTVSVALKCNSLARLYCFEQPWCGNGVCESGRYAYESCSSCRFDCGNCPTPQPTPTCFLGDTKITTPNGYKEIKDVKEGDYVLSYNEKTEKIEKSKVTKTFEHKANSYLVINDKAKVTSNHPMHINGEWQEIGKAKIGDKLKTSNGEETIKTIEIVNEPAPVYNLEVDKNHNYYAEDYLAHNKAKQTTI